jgi:hypothetical protein
LDHTLREFSVDDAGLVANHWGADLSLRWSLARQWDVDLQGVYGSRDLRVDDGWIRDGSDYRNLTLKLIHFW